MDLDKGNRALKRRLGHYASSEELDAYLRIVAARAQSRLGIAQLE